MVLDMPQLSVTVLRLDIAVAREDHFREDRIVDALECFCDQRRADRAGWIAAAEGEEPASPPRRDRRSRHQVAGEIPDMLHVILITDAFPRKRDHPRDLGVAQSDRPA